MTKLHLGNGTIYLENYTNIDLDIKGHYLVTERPDLVEKNKTTIENYYKQNVTKVDFLNEKYQKLEVVCDVFADVRNLPFKSVDEILAVQLFEHFTFNEGRELLNYWLDILSRGGKLHLDIPDLEGNIRLYNKAKNQFDRDWAVRLLYGSQKNKYGIHQAMYSKFTIRRLLDEVGFVNIKFENLIKHTYPAFGVTAYKTRTGRKHL